MRKRPPESREHYEWRQRRRAANIRKIIQALGGQCVTCGSTTDLEFDHIDPWTKEELGKQLKDWSWQRIQSVLWKFQLLCDTCHNERTLVEGHNLIRHSSTPPDWVTDMTVDDDNTTYEGE